jgi:hypothetical protein
MSLNGRAGSQELPGELARVDALVEELKEALRRNGIQLPSLWSDVMPTRGRYLVHLGRVPQEMARDLIVVLHLAADAGADSESAPPPPGTSAPESAAPNRLAAGKRNVGGEPGALRSLLSSGQARVAKASGGGRDA